MRGMMRCLFIGTFLLTALQHGEAQQGNRSGRQEEVSLTGVLVDSGDAVPLAGAHILLIHIRDTSRIYQTVTDPNGKFSIYLARGRYNLKATFVGYQTLTLDGEKAVRASSDHNDAGTLRMVKGTYLEEAEITSHRSTTRIRGDTLDFDAQAFKVNPDANAEDLIRRIPGINVDGDRVEAQGEDVQKVLVDGREFFGDDPSIALRNLPAEIIERVEVYDRMSDQSDLTGFDDGQRSKTINIVTRLDSRRGQFGRAYLGYGGDERYQMGLSTNIFRENSRISILGMSNNVNEQNFSREDIISLYAGAIRGGRGGGAGRGMGRAAQRSGGSEISTMEHVSDYRIQEKYGDNKTHALGLNYSDAWLNNNLELTGSYFYNLSDNYTDQFTDRQYFMDESDRQYYQEDSESNSRNSNHRLNVRMTWDIDNKNSLIFLSKMIMQSNTADSHMNALNLLEDNHLLSTSEIGYDSDLSGYNYSSLLIYRHRFEKTGRTISTNLSANFNDNQSLHYLDALSDYVNGEDDEGLGEQALSDFLRQKSDSKTINRNLSSNITYTEPLGETGLLQAGYHIRLMGNENNRITNSWDPDTGSYLDFEPGLSTSLISNYLTHRGSLGYRFSSKKLNLTLEMAYQYALLSGTREFPDVFTLPKREFQNFLPRVMLIYTIKKGKSLRFNYRTSTNPPSVTQLQESVDNSNPVLLSSGNPNLDHSYSHFFMARYKTTNIERSTNFFAAVFGNISGDYIGNSIMIARADTILSNGYVLKKGSQFSQPVNLDGFRNIRSHISYGFPLRYIKSNLSLTSGLAWVRQPGLVNDRCNIANTYTTMGGFILSSNISPDIDFSVSFNAGYNIVENTLQPQLDNNYFSQKSGTRLSFIFLDNWVFRSDVGYLMYRGLGDEFNQDFILWNMNVGRKLFQKNLGEITLSVFDLLDQNKNIIRNVSDLYVEDLRTNQLSRFFMLTFTYNLRNFKV
ncbi:MAG: TonB-dependent receptor [Bacteroidota bacterium]